MSRRFLRESGLVKDYLCRVIALLQLEPGNRIDTFWPVAHTPCLHHTLARNELDIAAGDLPAEAGKAATRTRVDFRRRAARKGAELFRVGERVEDLAGARIVGHFVMDLIAHETSFDVRLIWPFTFAPAKKLRNM